MHLIKKLTPLLFLFAPIVANADLPYTSTFTDNGNMVREVRDYGNYINAWEWLDLSVTKGITYESIRKDLQDNNILDSSYELEGDQNSINDIFRLSPGDAHGWILAYVNEVDDLASSFFGENVESCNTEAMGRNTYKFGGQRFVEMFGITEQYKEHDHPLYGNTTMKIVAGWTYALGEADHESPVACEFQAYEEHRKNGNRKSEASYKSDFKVWFSNLKYTEPHAHLGAWLIRPAATDR